MTPAGQSYLNTHGTLTRAHIRLTQHTVDTHRTLTGNTLVSHTTQWTLTGHTNTNTHWTHTTHTGDTHDTHMGHLKSEPRNVKREKKLTP